MYLHKCVNSHDSHVWLAFGIVHQVEVNQLFQFQVVRLHAVHNIWKQSTARGTNCDVTSDKNIYTYIHRMAIFPAAHLTSLPTVIDAMTFFTASFFFSFLSLFSSALSSNISPDHIHQREKSQIIKQQKRLGKVYHIDVPRTQCRYNDKQCTLICQKALKTSNEWIRWFACGPAVLNFR